MSRIHLRPPASPLRGSPALPGDKSVSIRRALLSLLTDRDLALSNYTSGTDGRAALHCLRELGKFVSVSGNDVAISGAMDRNSATLDCGNSGTTARLLMGLLAARAGEWIITGDDSLSRRPMERVAAPLRSMGAHIELTAGGLPAHISGAPLRGIRYATPVPSAQVKSAVLLAGLQASGTTVYREMQPTRDHTERLLGLTVDTDGWITLDPAAVALDARRMSDPIPNDPSAAAFWVAAALLVSDSRLRLSNVLLNPLRTGCFRVLRAAGAQIQIEEQSEIGGEPVGVIRVDHSSLSFMHVSPREVPAVIDELPVLAVLAAHNRGGRFENVGELRVKESDRLAAILSGLSRMQTGAACDGDVLTVSGGGLAGAHINSAGDHRIAMAFAVAALAARGETTISKLQCAAVSDAHFWTELARLAPACVRAEA